MTSNAKVGRTQFPFYSSIGQDLLQCTLEEKLFFRFQAIYTRLYLVYLITEFFVRIRSVGARKVKKFCSSNKGNIFVYLVLLLIPSCLDGWVEGCFAKILRCLFLVLPPLTSRNKFSRYGKRWPFYVLQHENLLSTEVVLCAQQTISTYNATLLHDKLHKMLPVLLCLIKINKL